MLLCRRGEKAIKKKGLALIRPKLVPGNPPSEEVQREFIHQYKEIRKTTGKDKVILFCDAMHLIHQVIPGLFWGDPKDLPSFATNSGRKRINIIGAYDPHSKGFVHYTNETNCNAESVILFFQEILKSYPEAKTITLILDNATYFHAKIVREWLEKQKKITCWFLPAYSPNLNLIERFWRFTKKHLVRNTYYAEYKNFRAKVFQFLNNPSEHIDELSSLMTENFEIISN